MNALELVGLIRRDVAEIDDLIRWAHADGYHAGAGAPRCASGSGPLSEAPRTGSVDQVPGARLDLGIGSHRSRQGYHDAVAQIRRLELRLDLAVVLALPDDAPRPARLLGGAPAFAQVRRALAIIPRRLDLIAEHEAEREQARRRQTRRALRAASGDAELAWLALVGAFQVGPVDPETQATGEPLCRICEARPRVAKAAGRCATCATWRYRNGFERPKKLDGLQEAHDARRRRRARGQGWGDG